MAKNKLIEELIIQVKQKGVKTTTKAITELNDALVGSEASAAKLNNTFADTPGFLSRIQTEAAEAAKSIAKMNTAANGGQITAAMEGISESIQSVVDELLETNYILTKMNNSMIESFSELSNSLGHDLERVEDRMIDVGEAATKTHQKLEKFNTGVTKGSRALANQNRQGRNAKRTFSDLAKVAGPLPLLYAQMAANIFAVSEAMRIMTEGDQLNRLREVGTIMGASMGAPIQLVAESMRELTGQTISFRESMEQATSAVAYGFDTKQIEAMTQIARRASVAFGVDMSDALNRIIRGTSKLEIELLDELGITTKLTTAYKNYADKIGVSADSLTSYQQRLALVNEAQAQSVQKLGILDGELAKGTPWEMFSASAKTAFDNLLAKLAEATGGVATFFAELLQDSDVRVATKRAEVLKDSLAKALEMDTATGITGNLKTVYDYIDDIGIAVKAAKTNLDTLEKARDTAAAKDTGIFSHSKDFVMADAQYTKQKSKYDDLKKVYDELVSSMDESTSAFGGSRQKIIDLFTALGSVKVAAANSKPSIDSFISSLTKAPETASFSNAVKDVSNTVNLFNSSLAGMSGDVREKALKDFKEAFKGMSPSDVQELVDTSNAYIKAVEGVKKAEGTVQARDAAKGSTTMETYYAAQIANVKELEDAIVAKNTAEAKITGKSTPEGATKELEAAKKYRDISMESYDYTVRKTEAESLINKVGQDNLHTLRDTLAAEQARAVALKDLPQTQEMLAASSIKQLEIENQINEAILSRSRSIMDSAFSNLSSYGTGLSQLSGSLNDIALSFNNLGESSMTATQMTATGLQAFQGMLQYTSNSAASAIDAQITAEQNRDGSSEESLAKIKALNAKKIKEQTKAAQQQILISTAVATMMAAANPWPLPAIPLMASAIATGAMAYQQASASGANQLSALNASSESSISLSVGSKSNTVDVAQSATSGELSYMRGESGIGSISSYTPRASGGSGTPGMGIVVGEHGPEYMVPKVPVNIESASSSNKQSQVVAPAIGTMVIQALDSQSILDRAKDIYDAFDAEATSRGQDIRRLE